jgi:hypothetical protein
VVGATPALGAAPFCTGAEHCSWQIGALTRSLAPSSLTRVRRCLACRTMQARALQSLGTVVPARLEQSPNEIAVDGWEEVDDLDSHDDGDKLPESDWLQLIELGKACRLVVDGTGRASVEACVDLLLRVQCNGFGLFKQHQMELRSRSFRHTSKGRGLFPSASFFNHSCAPNCTFFVDELGCLTVATTASVQPGEQLCIPYVSVARRRDTVAARRAVLLKEFYFRCCCERCLSEAGKTNE